MVFSGFSPAGGRELWATDGSATGTRQITDIVFGTGSSDPKWPVWLRPAPDSASGTGLVLFTAGDARRGRELWRIDAASLTLAMRAAHPPASAYANADAASSPLASADWAVAAGASLVSDLHPGSAGSDPQETVAVRLPDGSVAALFNAEDGSTGRELWRSDGSASGTGLVLDIQPGSGGSRPLALTLVTFGAGSGPRGEDSLVFFSADDGSTGRELWATDGTAAGTRLVADVVPGSTGSHPWGLTPWTAVRSAGDASPSSAAQHLFFTALPSGPTAAAAGSAGRASVAGDRAMFVTGGSAGTTQRAFEHTGVELFLDLTPTDEGDGGVASMLPGNRQALQYRGSLMLAAQRGSNAWAQSLTRPARWLASDEESLIGSTGLPVALSPAAPGSAVEGGSAGPAFGPAFGPASAWQSVEQAIGSAGVSGSAGLGQGLTSGSVEQAAAIADIDALSTEAVELVVAATGGRITLLPPPSASAASAYGPAESVTLICPLAECNRALRRVFFTADTDGRGVGSVTFTVRDTSAFAAFNATRVAAQDADYAVSVSRGLGGRVGTAQATVLVDIAPVNRPPSISLPRYDEGQWVSDSVSLSAEPGPSAVLAGQAMVLPAGRQSRLARAISLSDADWSLDEPKPILVSVAADTGRNASSVRVSLGFMLGLSMLEGSGTMDTRVVFVAAPADANRALAGLTVACLRRHGCASGTSVVLRVTITDNDAQQPHTVHAALHVAFSA
jgi:ELWxxDGT repeat protein